MLSIVIGLFLSWLVGKLGNTMNLANLGISAAIAGGAIAMIWSVKYTDLSVIIWGGFLGFLGWCLYAFALSRRWIK